MSRIRVIALSMGLVIAALLAHSVSVAQQGGGPPGGGRGGRGGPGGFGGFGLLGLASRPGVQAELKLTDKQKADVKALSDKIEARGKEQRERMRERFKNAGGRPGGPQGKAGETASKTESGDAKSKTNGVASVSPTKSKTADAKGKTTGKASAKGKGAAENGPGGQFADFRAAFAKQQAEDESELAKLLNPTQRTRLVQIQIQQEGPRAFAKADFQKKLGMTQSQVEDIAAVLDQSRSARNDIDRERRALFGGGDRGNNRGGNNGGGNNRGGNNGGGNFGGGNFGGGNNGGGRGNNGGFDRAAFQAKMQDPQFKAQLESMRKKAEEATDLLQDQTMQQIGSVLSKKQKVAYNKFRGPDFDLAKLDRNYDPSTAPKEETDTKTKSGASGSSKKKSTTKTKKSA